MSYLYPASCYWIPFIIEKHGFFPQNKLLQIFRGLTLELMDKIRPLNDEHAACLGFTNSSSCDQKPPNSASLLHLISQKSWFCWAACAPGIPACPNQFHLTSSWKCQIVSRLVSCSTRSCSSLIMRRVVFIPSMNKHRERFTTPLGTLPQISRKICECTSFMRCSSRLT